MRHVLCCAISALWLWLSLPAHACGGGFGQQVTLNPSQKIVLGYRNGEETYVFRPHFCGAATDFGLILPVPAALTREPTLGNPDLVSQLEVVTAARVQTVEVCTSGGFFLGSGSDKNGGAGAAPGTSNDGVAVISAGQVGEFQWQLLQADSAQSFTDWLDANSFPYPASAQAAFDHYVQAGWYFVAFSVAAGALAPPAGYRLCGDFGPIELSFPATQAVIPARIAAAGDTTSTFLWRVFTLSTNELQASSGSSSAAVFSTLRYAGALSADDLVRAPAVASVGSAGEWLTELDLSFRASNLTQDIWLDRAPADTPYRRTEYVVKEVDCGVFGCSIAPSSRHERRAWPWLVAVAAVLVAAGRRRLSRV
jgi:hypothetical protein